MPLLDKVGTIKLLMDLPIADSHGATKDRVFDCTKVTNDERIGMRWWFQGDTGELCAALIGECVFTKLPSKLAKS